MLSKHFQQGQGLVSLLVRRYVEQTRGKMARLVSKCAELARGKGDVTSVVAVRGESFDIMPGEKFALIGESAGGKTTVARLVVGALRPTSGAAHLCHGDRSVNVHSYRRDDVFFLRSHAQLVYQEADVSLDPRASVGKSIEEAYVIHFPSLRSWERRSLTNHLLSQVCLPLSKYHAFPDELSGGERKRVTLVRALAALGYGLEGARVREDQLLVVDEPTSGMDAIIQDRILSLLQDATDQLKLACLFISHDLRTVEGFCDRIAIMYRGSIIEMGQAKDIFAADPSSAALHPFSRQLLASTTAAISDGEIENWSSPTASGCPFKLGCEHYDPDDPEPRCDEPQTLKGRDNHLVACWRAQENLCGEGSSEGC